jgi:hypothetical protein
MTSDSKPGSCYGFAVRSTLPFRFLRGGDGQDLDVFMSPAPEDGTRYPLLQEWPSEDPPGHKIRIYGEGGVYRLSSSFLGWFTIDATAPSIAVPDTGQHLGREQMTVLTAMLLCFYARGDTSLHSAAVDLGGEAIIIAAPGSFGKTTLSAAFWRAGYRLLNEDLTCIRPAPVPAVLAGPAMIRLRRDVAEQLELPDVETVVTTPTRVCYALAGRRRGDCSPIPIRAVILLMGWEDEFRLEPADPAEAVRDLWTLTGLFPTEADYARRFKAVSDLVARLPVYNVVRPRGFDALDATVERIVAGV